MKLISQVFLCSAIIFLTACTPYQQNSGLSGFIGGGGFNETQLSGDVYQVTFEGNKYTAEQRAKDFTLLRCAELTIDKGYGYFRLINSDSKLRYRTQSIPGSMHVQASSKIVSEPSTSNTIQLLYEKTPDVFVYDAKIIVSSLKTQYKIK